jgi:hypothetical protein
MWFIAMLPLWLHAAMAVSEGQCIRGEKGCSWSDQPPRVLLLTANDGIDDSFTSLFDQSSMYRGLRPLVAGQDQHAKRLVETVEI